MLQMQDGGKWNILEEKELEYYKSFQEAFQYWEVEHFCKYILCLNILRKLIHNIVINKQECV